MSVAVEILRQHQYADGVFGTLWINDEYEDALTTLEDDWLQNAPRSSCIPSGHYEMARTVYRKHNYETFEILDVPHRERILIHPGNTEEDTMGCVLVGLRRGIVVVPRDEDTGRIRAAKYAVVSSQEAFGRFMRRMSGVDKAPLTIRWAMGLPQ